MNDDQSPPMRHWIVSVREGTKENLRGEFFDVTDDTWKGVQLLEDQGWEMEFYTQHTEDRYPTAVFMRQG